MIGAREVASRERAWPALDPWEWVRAFLAEWGARLAAWKSGGEDDPSSAADPQLVAALEILAGLMPEDADAG